MKWRIGGVDHSWNKRFAWVPTRINIPGRYFTSSLRDYVWLEFYYQQIGLDSCTTRLSSKHFANPYVDKGRETV